MKENKQTSKQAKKKNYSVSFIENEYFRPKVNNFKIIMKQNITFRGVSRTFMEGGGAQKIM